jgi:hypothetical protein
MTTAKNLQRDYLFEMNREDLGIKKPPRREVEAFFEESVEDQFNCFNHY